MFDNNEILEWENNIYIKKMESLYGNGIKNYKDPRKERLKNFRHQLRGTPSYNKEPKDIRIFLKRLDRHIVKDLIKKEKYEEIVPMKKSRGWYTY